MTETQTTQANDPTKGGVSKAMKYFGKKDGQSIKDFADEWNALTQEDKVQLTQGLSGDQPSLTY